MYLGLIKNFRNLKRIKIESQDRNINVLLQEFLPRMNRLVEIHMDSKAPRVEERFEIIRNFVTDLKILSVAPEHAQIAKNFFGNGVDVKEMIV